MDNNIEELLSKLKSLGVDIMASEYASILATDNEKSDEVQQRQHYKIDNEECSKEYIAALETYVRSMDFMRLGQSIQNKQWQAAAMKANKMSIEAKRLGMIRFERPFIAIRQNINRKNSKEALQALSGMIAIRVKLIELLGIR